MRETPFMARCANSCAFGTIHEAKLQFTDKDNKSIQMSRHLYGLIITNMFKLSRVFAELFGKQQIFFCQLPAHADICVLVGADKGVQVYAAGEGREGRSVLGGELLHELRNIIAGG